MKKYLILSILLLSCGTSPYMDSLKEKYPNEFIDEQLCDGYVLKVVSKDYVLRDSTCLYTTEGEVKVIIIPDCSLKNGDKICYIHKINK